MTGVADKAWQDMWDAKKAGNEKDFKRFQVEWLRAMTAWIESIPVCRVSGMRKEFE